MCTFRGTFAFSASSPVGLCGQPTTINVYSSTFNVGNDAFNDAGCTSEISTGYYCNSQYYFEYDADTGITVLSTNCSSAYCVFDTAGNDDTFYSAGTYQGNFYYTGATSGNYIYYSTGDTLWCLSTTLGGTCLQFGPLGSTSPCPDLDDTLFTTGVCVTTTTTTNPCVGFDFDAIFDCDVTITPSDTPTPTPTPTPTLTPTQTNVCGGANFAVTAVKFTPTPSLTSSPTPTPTSSTSYSCVFSGTVTFNSISEVLQCGDSKQFRDCFTGVDYYTSQAVLDEFGNNVSEGYVYSTTINNIGRCVIFVGTVSNISGMDDVIVYQTIGLESAGSCLLCAPIASATPTMTPTSTPTPTPTLPCSCQNYLVTPSPSETSFTITDCETNTTRTLSPFNFGLSSWGSQQIAVCSKTVPNTAGSYVSNGDCCVPTYCNIWTTTNTAPIVVNFYYRNLSGLLVTQTLSPGQTVSVSSIINPYQDSGTLVFTNTGVNCIPNSTPTPTPTNTSTPTPTPSNPACVFSMTVDTTITNSSTTAGNRFKLPNTPYWSNVSVDWGDGVIQTFGSGAHPAHIYPTGGIYQIKIYPNFGGVLVGLNFNVGSNDQIKILSIDSWCGFFPAEDDSLYGATNLNLASTTGVPNIPGSVSANVIPVGGQWNFFEGTSCTQLNNVGSWDISDLGIISWGSGGGPNGIDLIPSNYNSLLIGWASLGASLQSGVIFDAGTSQYNASAVSARNYLTTTKGWTITDGGLI